MDPLTPEAPSGDTLPPLRENEPERPGTSQELHDNAPGRLLALALAAGLIAGVASIVAGEVILGHYGAALDLPPSINPNPELMRRWKEARLYSASLSFTTLAGLLGLAMGMAGGLARRSAAAGVRAAFVGAALGIAVVAPTSLALVSNFFARHDPQSVDLMLPLLTHGAIWSAVGAIGGLALGVGIGGQGRWKATLAGGLVGAGAATIIYEIAGALAFASSKTELPLSSSVTTRAMAQLLVAILSARGAVLILHQPTRRTTSSSIAS
jgi:MFS family permease